MQDYSLYLIIGLAVVIGWSFLRNRMGGPFVLDVPEPDGKPLIIDVRQPFEFRSGHAVGAVNIPVGMISRVGDALGPKDRPLVVYCRSGSRSGGAARTLGQLGFSKVRDAGGLNAARSSGIKFE